MSENIDSGISEQATTPDEATPEAAKKKIRKAQRYFTRITDFFRRDPEVHTPDASLRYIVHDEDPSVLSARPESTQSEVPKIPQEKNPILRDEEQLANLQREFPELLEGKLPRELARMLPEEFRKRYALGFNQSEGCQSVEQAMDLLNRNRGIGMANYSIFGSRFRITDAEYEDNAKTYKNPKDNFAVQGYYGSSLGRFVVAFPVSETKYTNQPTRAVVNSTYDLHIDGVENYPYPKDLVFKIFDDFNKEETVVNQKYLAGFIDVRGHFHINSNFMK